MWRLLLGVLALLASAPFARAAEFGETVAEARGQTVYLNAWGGQRQINDYLAWAAEEVQARFGIELRHVKLTDTAEAVTRVLAEKAARRHEGGSIDLIWINGENFKAMKDAGLLFGPFAQRLPGWRLVDTVGKPTTLVDFTIPTEGFESPWGMAQFVLFHDEAVVPHAPRTPGALRDWIRANPGRFTYPAPPDFVGSTFLKQLVAATTAHPERLQAPADGALFGSTTEPLWRWLDEVRPALWREGTAYPASGPALHQLLDDGEVDFSMAFNPAEASSLILAGRLPPTVRSFILEGGTIGNTHFLAIPFNAAHKAGAMVIADFLLSPEAQTRKEDPAVWGDPTVLAVDRLAPEDRARFAAIPRGPATLPPEALTPVLPEPHPSWMELIERRWAERYGL